MILKIDFCDLNAPKLDVLGLVRCIFQQKIGFKRLKTGCEWRPYGHPTESIKELIKLTQMICRHLVWELFDRNKKHRG